MLPFTVLENFQKQNARAYDTMTTLVEDAASDLSKVTNEIKSKQSLFQNDCIKESDEMKERLERVKVSSFSTCRTAPCSVYKSEVLK